MNVVHAMLPVLLILCDCSAVCYSSTSEKQTIYLLALLPYYNPDPSLNPSWNDGDNIQPALELAKDQINNSSALLPNYTLELIHAEGGCNHVSRTSVAFIRELFRNNLTGVIGPGCSSSTIRIAPLINRTALSLVMVHGSGSPTLVNRTTYRYSLGTLGSTQNFVEGFVYLTGLAKWRKVAILFDDSRLYHKNTMILLNDMLKQNVMVEYASPVSFTFLPLDIIAESFIRIVFVLCPIELSRRIICLSYNRNMTYSNYQWVFMSQRLQELQKPLEEFLYEGMRYACSEDEMLTALNRSLFMIYRLTPSTDETLISNTTYLEYLRYYEEYREIYNMKPGIAKPSNFTFWSTYLYDAVWAWAKVLDVLTTREDFQLTEQDYTNVTRTRMITDQFYRTTFQGMSGKIDFSNDSGFPQSVVNLSQVLNGHEMHIAYIAGNDDIIHVADPEVIPDSFDTETARESLAVGVFFTFIVIIQLSFILILHIITVIHSSKSSIKASSPKLLHLSYTGAYVLVAAVLVYQLKSIHEEAKCWFSLVTWAWLFPIGFTLAFGPVAMRTWRLYRIFQHYLNPGPLISDQALFGVVTLLVCVDFTIGALWTSLDPFTQVNGTDFNAMGALVKEKTDCICEHYYIWFAAIVTHKLLLLLVVTVLAFLTRNIPNRSFTTNALRVLSYITAIIFVLGFSVHYIVFEFSFDPNNKFVTFLCVLCLLMTVFIICIFIPPVSPILIDFCQSQQPGASQSPDTQCHTAIHITRV